jgi:membrane protein implicated in regulation of membrane protease activity
MTIDQILWVFIIAGVFFIVLEFFVHGLVSVFFGIGAIIIGLLFWYDFICNIYSAVLFWTAISLILIFTFRNLALKIFPSKRKKLLKLVNSEDIGSVVEVVHFVDEITTDGRISYNGTSWPAISYKGVIKQGQKARLLFRDNLTWVVEPCDPG